MKKFPKRLMKHKEEKNSDSIMKAISKTGNFTGYKVYYSNYQGLLRVVGLLISDLSG
jgi:hypothetical protein